MPGPNELDPTLAALAEGQRVFGRFTLVRALGRGTLGVVWFARDETQQRDVELKFLPEVLTRDVVAVADLKLEVERVRDLRHDVFQAIYDFHEDGTRAALCSEFVPGNTLGALCEVRLNGCFDAAELLPWIEPLGDALTHAHRQQLVHRALHPGHLVLTPAGRVKALDFGIAHALHEASMRHRGDESGSGTLTYASPQLAAGALPVPEDDVYSLGATLYDLLAGAAPFSEGGIVPMTQRRAMQDRWGAPIPSAWERVIASCLAKDPAQRPAGVAALMQALREGLKSAPAPAQGEPVVARVDPPPPAPPAPPPASAVQEPPAGKLSVPIAPKVVAANRGTPVVIPPAAPIAVTLPEVEAARAINVQKAHHRGALVALVCLAAAWLAARTMSERGLPPVLPEAPTPPPVSAKAAPKPAIVPPVIPTPPPSTPVPIPATPAPLPATPAPPQSTPAPMPATPAPAIPIPPQSTPAPIPATPAPTIPIPPQSTPAPVPAIPAPPVPAPATTPPATPAPLPSAPIPPPATPAPPVPSTPVPATPPPAPRRAEPVPSSTPPKLGARWTNTLGMPFAPIPKLPVLVAIWETRARDFEAFAKATALPWEPPADGSEYPVANVSFLNAMLFCDWLTTTEQTAGKLKPGQRYRLPTDAEWSAAAGIPPETGATLAERDDAGDKTFPWGAAWPPPPGAGNFRGLNPEKAGANTATIGDVYERLAPVGSFEPTRYGVFDLAGNAAEMVSDFIAPELGLHATRGGSFRDDTERALRLRARGVGESGRGTAPYIGFRIVLDPAAKN